MLIGIFYILLFGPIPLLLKRKPPPYTKSDLVSILLPVFNDGDILEKNLQNLVQLKYPNLEIIVIYSERSTDRTEEVALAFAEAHENIYALSENVSKGHALNLGIDQAKGEFLLFLDSDVFIYDGFIEQTLSHFTDENIKIVNAYCLGLNARQNLVTTLNWSINSYSTFFGIGSNKFLKHIFFAGYGAIWRKNALLEAGKFLENTYIEDAEICLRANSTFPEWKGIFDDQIYCYQYYSTDFRSFYLQLMRWTSGNIKYVAKGVLKVKGMGIRQKFLYISQFLMGTLFPMIGLYSMGMGIVQFFANFFYPDISFGGGLFFFLISIISLFITFISMLIFIYPKYRNNPQIKMSRKSILFSVFVIMYLVGIIFGVVSLNSMKNIVTKKDQDTFFKVDKSKIQIKE